MKIYVAGKFEEKDKVLELYEKLRNLGHEVSYDWTTHENCKPYEQNQEVASKYSDNELKGIAEADVFIYLSHEKGTTLKMEFGAALVANLIQGAPKLYAVGESNNRSPWFFNSRVVRRGSVDEVLEDLSF